MSSRQSSKVIPEKSLSPGSSMHTCHVELVDRPRVVEPVGRRPERHAVRGLRCGLEPRGIGRGERVGGRLPEAATLGERDGRRVVARGRGGRSRPDRRQVNLDHVPESRADPLAAVLRMHSGRGTRSGRARSRASRATRRRTRRAHRRARPSTPLAERRPEPCACVLHPAHRVELMRRDHRAEGSNCRARRRSLPARSSRHANRTCPGLGCRGPRLASDA